MSFYATVALFAIGAALCVVLASWYEREQCRKTLRAITETQKPREDA